MTNLVNNDWIKEQDKAVVLEKYVGLKEDHERLLLQHEWTLKDAAEVEADANQNLKAEIKVLRKKVDIMTEVEEERDIIWRATELKIKKMENEITELKEALEMENEARQQEHIEQQIEEYVATPPHWSDKY